MSFELAGLLDDDFDFEGECNEIQETTSAEEIKNDGLDKKYLKVLKKQFGHSQFRPMQWKIIRSILEDHRDVSAIMATGYGKSLCYQFPSVYSGGITIVVSPLISLMEDQVLALTMANVPACLLGSAQTKQKSVIDGILSGEYRIVYVTPEFILGDYGSDILAQIGAENIALLAIDEAHCVSKWGHDFRPQYRNLWKLRASLKDVPVLAVTATATPTVQKDIALSLKLKNPLLLCSGFDRPNLYFEVRLRSSADPYSNIKPCINEKEMSGSTIIYCISKKITEDVALNLKVNGINNVVYHAGLTMKQRKAAHEQFVKDKVKVVVATIAFGMGIDKPDVRTIIHYGCAKDIEGYYQEVGRAGRDGLPAKCYVLYNTSDFNLHQLLRESTSYVSKDFKTHQEQSSALMEKFLNSQDCRRKFILDYFEDNISDYNKTKKNCCDNCTRASIKPLNKIEYEGVDKDGLYNFAPDFKLYLDAINACEGKFGTEKYILFLRGSKSNKLYPRILKCAQYGSGKHRSDEWWKIIARTLSAEGFFKKNFQKGAAFSFNTISVSKKGETFLKKFAEIPNFELKLPIPTDMKKLLTKVVPPPAVTIDTQAYKWMEKQNNNVLSKKPSTTSAITTEADDPVEKQHRKMLYANLLAVRNNIAHGADTMPYIIASNTALMQMSRLRPTNMMDLLSYTYDGLNEVKLKNYGQKFIDCVNQYYAINPIIKSIQPEKPTLSGSSETSDKLSGLSRNSNNSDTNVVNIKQYAFVEKSKVFPHLSEDSTSQNNEPVDFDDKSNSEISDTQFNEIMDFLENDPDETICEANNSNNDFQIPSCSNNKKSTNIDEPSALMNEDSLELNAELFKLCDSGNTENATNNSQDKKRRLSSTDEEIEIVPKKPTKILSKYLDF